MLEFFKKLFDSSDWPPRWHCGKWSEFHGWLYIISDLLIWSAYFAIPLVIIRYISRRHNTKFIKLYFLFAAFILACGATHFLDAVAFWIPMYRLNALVRFITGIISWVTVFFLIKYLPAAFSLRSQSELELEIQNRMAAEQKVNLLNTELRSLMKAASAELQAYKIALDAAAVVVITDQDGTITYINDSFCKLSGYAKDEVLGYDHRLISSGYHSKIFMTDMWKTIKSGEIWNGEFKNKTKDGKPYWVSATIVPLTNEDGVLHKYMAIERDITHQKKMDEAFYRNERIYQTIASSIPDAIICLLDETNRYTLVEGDMLENLHLSKNVLVGREITEVLPEEMWRPLQQNLNRVFDGETFYTESKSYDYDLLNRYVPLKDEKGNVFNAMIVTVDITDLKKAQRNVESLNQSLSHQLKEMETFSYSVSHDLRAPLRAISGYTKILMDDFAPILDLEAKTIIETILANATRMGRLIDDLLNFSRVGRREISMAPINMEKTVRTSIDELTNNTVKDMLTINVHALPDAKGDAAMIKQVWINLIGNAIKYSSKTQTPSIDVGGITKDGIHVYYVKDNGVGFDTKYAHKLFGIFQRLHGEDEFEGTGVGLALVERIVQKHNGKVWAEGIPGKGATFYFSIPGL